MSDEWMNVSLIKWITGAFLSIGIWVGTIEQRLRHKADKEQVAKDPVEAAQVEALVEDVHHTMKQVREAQQRNSEKLTEVREDIATLMERTKEKRNEP